MTKTKSTNPLTRITQVKINEPHRTNNLLTNKTSNNNLLNKKNIKPINNTKKGK